MVGYMWRVVGVTYNIASNWRLELEKEVIKNNWYLFVQLLGTRYNKGKTGALAEGKGKKNGVGEEGK